MEIILATPAGGRYHDNCDSGVGGLLQGGLAVLCQLMTFSQPISAVICASDFFYPSTIGNLLGKCMLF